MLWLDIAQDANLKTFLLYHSSSLVTLNLPNLFMVMQKRKLPPAVQVTYRVHLESEGNLSSS